MIDLRKTEKESLHNETNCSVALGLFGEDARYNFS